MTITVSCPRCNKTYRLKDENAGKTFKCKGCQSPVKIPSQEADPWEADLDDFEDGTQYDDDEDAYRPPRATSRKKSKKKRSSSDGMPATVIIALVVMGLLSCMQLLGIVGSVAEGDLPPGRLISQVGGLILSAGIIGGLFTRSNVARWTGIVLYGLGALCSFSCGTISMVMISNPRFEEGFKKGLAEGGISLGFFFVVMGLVFAAYLTIVVCLIHPSSNDYFNS